MNFDDLPSEAVTTPPVWEKIDCQYCQDVGPCVYCKRGQEVVAEIKKAIKAAKKPKSRQRAA